MKYVYTAIDKTSTWIINNTFVGNTGPRGAGIILRDSTNAEIMNNVFLDNTASQNSEKVVAYSGGATAHINNCCAYNSGGPENNADNYYYSASANITNCLYQPPLFGDVSYHLSATSPCIDQGYNTPWNDGTLSIYGTPLDMDGDARIIGGVVDIGMDEYAYSGCRVAMPGFNPDGGIYPPGGTDVTVTCDTPDAVITYTTDGSEPPQPSETNQKFTPPGVVHIGEALVLKAKAWKDACTPSSIRSASYGIAKVATPTFTPEPAPGQTAPLYVTIDCTTPGAIITYSTDGISEPLNPYIHPDAPTITSGYGIELNSVTVLKARGWLENYEPSDTKIGTYVVGNTGPVVVLIASPVRIPSDGTSTTTITATVYGTQGQRLANQSVHLTTDYGLFLPEDSLAVDRVTNANGEASVILRSASEPKTATVSAAYGATTSRTYVEFANEGYPSIIITNPVGGAVSGFVRVDVSAHDTDTDSLRSEQLYIDGIPGGAITTSEASPSGIETERLSNGWHTLTARVVDLDGNEMWSQDVNINVYNTICNLQPSKTEIFTDDTVPGNIDLSAQMSESGTWSIQITDLSNNTVYSTAGYGPGPVQASWDGKVNGDYNPGFYNIVLTANAQQTVTKRFTATISAANADALICGALRGEEDWSREASVDEMIGVYDACREQGLTCTLLINPMWARQYIWAQGQGWVENPDYPYDNDTDQGNLRRLGIQGWLTKGYHYFFYSTHGQFVANPTKSYSKIMFFDPTGGQTWVCGNNYDVDPPNRKNVPAFSDIGIFGDQYRIVQINACWSGGAYIRNSYETDIPNAFGNYGAVEDEQTYLGWTTEYWPPSTSIFGVPVPILDGLYPCGTKFTKELWRQLGMGYTVGQAIFRTRWWNLNYNGWMDAFLYSYGGEDVTWLYY